MHIVATDGMLESPGLGRMPLAQRAAILPGVSLPSSVVRSIHRMARSSAQSFDDFLIDRLARDAARSSAPTSSTLRTPRMSDPRCESDRAVATLHIVGRGLDAHEASSLQAVAERPGGRLRTSCLRNVACLYFFKPLPTLTPPLPRCVESLVGSPKGEFDVLAYRSSACLDQHDRLAV